MKIKIRKSKRRNPSQNKFGFTVIEVLIASTIFTLAAVISSSILVDIVQIEKRTSVENAVYEDARILMEQIRIAVQQNAIDYSEYFSQYVIQDKENASISPRIYGINHGVYASRFYNPGSDETGALGQNPADLGVVCSSPADVSDPPDDCQLINQSTQDTQTGKNPWFAVDVPGVTTKYANAFCDKDNASCANGSTDIVDTDELYLLSSDGKRKLIFARMTSINAGENALGALEMRGRDADQNGFIDIFSCSESWTCLDDPDELKKHIRYPFVQALHDLGTGSGTKWSEVMDRVGLASSDNLNEPLGNLEDISGLAFIPISPMRLNLTALNFRISPLEDPYLAYAENDASEKIHPSVTITATFDLSDSAKENYPGEFQPFTLQTTVSSGVVGSASSYPPVRHIYDPSHTSDQAPYSGGAPEVPNSRWLDSSLPRDVQINP